MISLLLIDKDFATSRLNTSDQIVKSPAARNFDEDVVNKSNDKKEVENFDETACDGMK